MKVTTRSANLGIAIAILAATAIFSTLIPQSRALAWVVPALLASVVGGAASIAVMRRTLRQVGLLWRKRNKGARQNRLVVLGRPWARRQIFLRRQDNLVD